MNIGKGIRTLIVAIAIMGFASIGMAYNGGSTGYDGPDYGMGYGGYEYDRYEKEETTSETAEEEEIVAESETELMEEEEYKEEEERVAPVAGEGSEEIVPDIY